MVNILKCKASYKITIDFLFKILLFIADKIHEHNYRAVGSSNPEKSARVKANSVRNKCKEALTLCGLQAESVDFINWIRDVETSVSYINAFNHVNHLYHVNDEFHHDIDEATHFALTSLKKGREKTTPANRGNNAIDLEEGVKYPLKELAFFSVLADIYDNCEEYVFIYHRHWSVLERFFDGYYDNTPKPCMGFYVLD